MGNYGVESVDSIPIDIEQQETLTKQLEFLRLPGLSESSYNSFIKSIENNKGSEEYNKIIKYLLYKDNRQDIIDYIKDEGYPISKLSLIDFFSILNFSEEDKEKIEKDKEEVKNDNDILKEDYKDLSYKFLEKNSGLLSNIIDKKLYGYNIIKEFVFILKNGEYEDSKTFFSNNTNEILSVIAQSGDKNLFEKTHNFIKTSFPNIVVHDFNFYAKGNKWEENSNLSGQEKIIKGVENESDGMLSIDLSHIPAKSSLSLLNSNYSFDKKLDSKDINSALDEYLDAEGLVNEGMGNLNGFSDVFDQIVGKINGMTSNNRYKTTEDYKYGLKNIVESGKINLLGYMGKIKGIPEDLKITDQDIKNLGNNSEDYISNVTIIQNKIKKIREFLSGITILAYKKYEDKVKGSVGLDKEEQEGKLKTLNFIHSIGFDMIPQTDTNKLINQINSGVNINRNDIDLGEGFSLNTNIDLTNGILGFSDGINGTSTREKEIFIRFFNKMLTGNPISPININQALMNPKFQVNDTLIQEYRAKLYVGGSFNINETLKNLQKSTKNQNN